MKKGKIVKTIVNYCINNPILSLSNREFNFVYLNLTIQLGQKTLHSTLGAYAVFFLL